LWAITNRCWAETALGDWRAAEVSYTQWHTLAAALGGRVTLPDLVEALHVQIALLAGEVDAALARAEQAVATARAMNGLWGMILAERVWGEALARCTPPRWDEAEAHLAASLRACEEGDARLEAARTHVAWGKVAQARGNLEAACEHFQKAAAQFEASGLEQELNATRALLAAATGSPAHPANTRQP
jgi:hypothetical protein